MIFYVGAISIIVGLLVDHGSYGLAACLSLSMIGNLLSDVAKK